MSGLLRMGVVGLVLSLAGCGEAVEGVAVEVGPSGQLLFELPGKSVPQAELAFGFSGLEHLCG